MAPEDDIDLDNPPFPLTSIDRHLLAMKDEDFHEITWEDLRCLVGIGYEYWAHWMSSWS